MTKAQTIKATLRDVGFGRMILCKEDPRIPATSKCAQKLKETLTIAKRDLTASQLKIWRAHVYEPAISGVKTECDAIANRACRTSKPTCRDGDSQYIAFFRRCSHQIIKGDRTFRNFWFKQRYPFIWLKYLKSGALDIWRRTTPLPQKPPTRQYVARVTPIIPPPAPTPPTQPIQPKRPPHSAASSFPAALGYGLGRLCNATDATTTSIARCAKSLEQSMLAVINNLSSTMARNWLQTVFLPAVVQVENYCRNDASNGVHHSPSISLAQRYNRCTHQVIAGSRGFTVKGRAAKLWPVHLVQGSRLLQNTHPSTKGAL